jgi:hypothetical protein
LFAGTSRTLVKLIHLFISNIFKFFQIPSN